MIESKPNIFDGLEDWAGSSENLPVETTLRVAGGSKLLDLNEESKSGALKGVVNKFMEEGKHVGVSISGVPGEVKIFVAKHPHLIVAGIAATTGAILLMEAKRRRSRKKQ